jgi:hypothetical protein
VPVNKKKKKKKDEGPLDVKNEGSVGVKDGK